MSPIRKPLQAANNQDRPSQVRTISDRMLPVVVDVHYLHPDLLKKVLGTVISARRQIEGLVANDQNQGMLFPGLTEAGVQIPEKEADEIIRIAQSDLGETGIRLLKTSDSVKIVAEEEFESPYRATGY